MIRDCEILLCWDLGEESEREIKTEQAVCEECEGNSVELQPKVCTCDGKWIDQCVWWSLNRRLPICSGNLRFNDDFGGKRPRKHPFSHRNCWWLIEPNGFQLCWCRIWEKHQAGPQTAKERAHSLLERENATIDHHTPRAILEWYVFFLESHEEVSVVERGAQVLTDTLHSSRAEATKMPQRIHCILGKNLCLKKT